MEALALGLAALTLATACCAASLFEETHAVPMPVAQWGYRGMPGDIVQLKDGKLLMCYTKGGIMARTSEDGGRTWGEEFVLVANPGPPSRKGYYCHPSFVRLANGDLLLSYIYSAEALPYAGHNYYKRSADEGRTWSEQFVMTPYPGYVIVHNDKLRVLSTGRIIAPAEYKKRWPSERDHSGYVCLCFYSDDDGYSWHPARNDVDMDPHEAQEPHVVELRDGRLMMLFRTYSGFLGRSYSEDRGETWTPGELVQDLPISANACAVTVDRIPSTGDLVLIRTTGGEGGKRTPLTAAVSKDEGETWSTPRVIAGDPDDDYGYQSLDFVDDVALLSYHRRDGLWVARIGVGWFYQQ